MQGYNVIMLYGKEKDCILMCKRKKEPYLGLYNLVGGKIETGEDGFSAAYRELYEETGITKNDVKLLHLMDFKYYLQPCYVEVYVGRLKRDVTVTGDENELFWSDLSQNFFDMNTYAGEGNIGHMIEQVKLYEKQIFDDE
ncbi:MAG: NUDIX domain-containing protein [Oscillospiraceae bacterium]|nr:NUDIX domain-containing protein [Oscillospiraceae bacterium]